MPRLFFALQPTSEQNAALTAQIAPFVVEGAQAVPAANLHVTLCFIGAIAPEKLDDLKSVAAGVRGRLAMLSFDTLEHWEGPKVLCATASRDSPAARELATALCDAAVAAGFSPDIKPFRPHLTLARKVRGDLSVSLPQPLLPPTLMHCDHFVLMESRRGEAGSVYSALDSWPLYD
jgi:RNA 2',3'-cyclic 3'-phosphodiesterase